MKNKPIVAYYAVTLLISWGGLIVVLGGTDRFSSHVTNAPFLPLYFITVAGPSIAGFLLTGLYGGIKGYRELLSALCKWRAGFKWYLIAIMAAPLTVFTSLFVLSLAFPIYLPGIFSPGENPTAVVLGLPGNDKLGLVLFVSMLGIFNGFVEELGWTGFVTPRLNLNLHLFTAGLGLGIMWGLWHLFSNYVGIAPGAGALPIPVYLAVTLFSFLPPFRILMTWVYKQTGSLLLAIVMHASLDIFWLLSMPAALTGQQRVTWYLVWAAILWSLVAITRTLKQNESR